MTDDPWARYAPISLDALNAKAAMLERLDQKYIVGRKVLDRARVDLAAHFDVLEIDGLRSFTYETCYFDDPERRSYFDHHQGRRCRMKIRVRRYLEAQMCFVEVKLKDRRGVTVKRRMPYPIESWGTLDDAARAHVERCWRDLYGSAYGRPLEPVLWMRYRRSTLVARAGGERMTVDTGLTFQSGGRTLDVPPHLHIVETKSANGNGIADRVLRRLHQHPVSGCSKYCVGMGATGAVDRCNKFLPALRKLGTAPAMRSTPEPAHA